MAQAWILPAALALFLLLGPAVAGLAVGVTHAANAATRRADQSLRPVTATLLVAAPGPLGTSTWLDWEPARWDDGSVGRVTAVPVTAGTRADTPVRIWLDAAGRVQAPPLTPGEARGRVEGAITVTLTLLAVVLTALGLLVGWRLTRRRIASWEADWQTVEPLWSLLDRPE